MTSSGDRLAELKSLHKRTSRSIKKRRKAARWCHNHSMEARTICLTWDVTVPDTYAMSHLAHTSINAGEAAERAAESKRMKYSNITNTHAFVAVALES